MSQFDKENYDDLKHEVYKEAITKRRELSSYNENTPSKYEERQKQVLGLQSSNRANMSPIHPMKNTNYILSPSKDFPPSTTSSNNKFDTLKNTPDLMQDLINNPNLSNYLNSSAEKHLNYSRATISFRQSINVDNLISICTKKLEAEPNHRKALFIRASSFMKKGLFYEAIKDCNALLQMDPQNVGAYYTRGCAFEKLGEIDKGIADFTVVLQLDPNHVNAAFARGACQNRKGDFVKAIEDYNMALEKDIEKGPKKLQALRRSASKADRSEFSGSDYATSSFDRRNRLYQSPKGVFNDNQNVNPFVPMNNREEDFLYPEQNNNFLQMDNSQLMTNDLRGGMANSTPGMNSTTRSIVKNLNDDTISCTSEVSYQEQNPPGKKSERKLSEITVNEMLRKANIDSKDMKAKAEWFHTQGFEARKKGDFFIAIEFYTRALEICPNHFKALFNRGFAYDKIGSFDLAIEDYTQAIKLDPKNAYAYYNRGISLDRKNEYDEAIKNFTIAISLEPSKADFHHNRGFAYRKKKNFHQAIIDYSRAIELDSTHFKAFYNRAFCYDKIGDLQKAEADYLVALKLQPKNINALHHMGTLMEKIGGDRLYTALEYFNQVISLDSSYAPSFNGRGLVWDKLLNYDEAIKDFTKAMQLDQINPVFIHNRACCLRNMGRYKEALVDFDKALELDDKNPIIYSNIGLVWRKLENYEKAIENYTKELFFTKDNQKTYNNRAYCFAKLGKYKEAVSDYTKALSIDPKNIHALHNRGICYERLGLYRNAIEDFTTVISLNKSNANAYFNRGCCYDSIGELDLAIADYSLALEIDSKNGVQPKDKAH